MIGAELSWKNLPGQYLLIFLLRHLLFQTLDLFCFGLGQLIDDLSHRRRLLLDYLKSVRHVPSIAAPTTAIQCVRYATPGPDLLLNNFSGNRSLIAKDLSLATRSKSASAAFRFCQVLYHFDCRRKYWIRKQVCDLIS